MVFVSARKPPVAANSICPASKPLPPAVPQQPTSLPAPPAEKPPVSVKSKSYNIDFIVNGQTNNGDVFNKYHKDESLGTMANGNCASEKTDNCSYDCAKRERKCDNQNSDYVSDFKFRDSSSEVKHARTPINNVPPTHSPQLPIPSPNYPVQTQLTTETISSASLIRAATTTTTTTSAEHFQQQIKLVDANIPNTHVPTINNNYISAPHQDTSQKQIETEGKLLKEASNHQIINANANVNVFNDNCNSSNQKTAFHYDEIKVQQAYRNNCAVKVHSNNGFTNSNKENSHFTVLNVPNLNFQSPPTKKPKLSKIDLAIVRRKRRRQNRQRVVKINHRTATLENKTTSKYSYDFGVKVYGYSDSSSSNSYSSSECDSDSEVDLWIKSGPPCKLDLKPEKLQFLNGFDLTTHDKRNCKLFSICF